MIHTSPPGYFFSFLLFGNISNLEVADDVSHPSWSSWLDNWDQWHLLIPRSAYVDRKDLRPRGRVQLTKQSGVVPNNLFTGDFWRPRR